MPVVAPQKLKPVKVVAADVKAPFGSQACSGEKGERSGMFDFLVSAPKSSLYTRRENARARAPARAPALLLTPAQPLLLTQGRVEVLLDFLAPSLISVPKKEKRLSSFQSSSERDPAARKAAVAEMQPQ